MKAVVMQKPDEILPWIVAVTHANHIVTMGLFSTLIRAEFWSEHVVELCLERGVDSLVESNLDPSDILEEIVKEYPDDWETRVLH